MMSTEIFKFYKNSCTLFDAQNTGNHICFLISHFSGGILPDPLLGQRGLMAPSVVTAAYYAFSGHLYNVTECY